MFSLLRLTSALLLGAAIQTPAQSTHSKVVIAYSHHGSLTVATSSGKVLRTFKPSVPIGSFAISADGSKVVYGPLNPRSLGGPLYLLATNSGKIEQLTRGPYFNKNSGSEVYADPDFSPNGEHAVFVIHAQSKGDAVETAGPAATVNLKTGIVRTLQATKDVNGNGVVFANDPRWSPDGKQILVNFESGAALTDAEGTNLQDISGLMEGGDWTHALSWLGPECVIYIAGKDPKSAERNPARVLNLQTKKSQELAATLHLPQKSTANVMAVSPSIVVRRNGQELSVEGAGTAWTIPFDEGSTFVRILPTNQDLNRIPRTCNH